MRQIEKASYYGKAVGDMSRDQLLDLIEYLSEYMERKLREDRENIHAIALGKVEMMRRGLGG